MTDLELGYQAGLRVGWVSLALTCVIADWLFERIISLTMLGTVCLALWAISEGLALAARWAIHRATKRQDMKDAHNHAIQSESRRAHRAEHP